MVLGKSVSSAGLFHCSQFSQEGNPRAEIACEDAVLKIKLLTVSQLRKIMRIPHIFLGDSRNQTPGDRQHLLFLMLNHAVQQPKNLFICQSHNVLLIQYPAQDACLIEPFRTHHIKAKTWNFPVGSSGGRSLGRLLHAP